MTDTPEQDEAFTEVVTTLADSLFLKFSDDRETGEEVRTIVTTMEQEKIYPFFTELRERVTEGLPDLLNRECPEIIAMIPHTPFSPGLEAVAGRLIKGGTIWGTLDYFPGDDLYDFLDQLRTNVLEALPVLLGWLKAHEVMVQIPISPMNATPNLPYPYSGWICGTVSAEKALMTYSKLIKERNSK